MYLKFFQGFAQEGNKTNFRSIEIFLKNALAKNVHNRGNVLAGSIPWE